MHWAPVYPPLTISLEDHSLFTAGNVVLPDPCYPRQSESQRMISARVRRYDQLHSLAATSREWPVSIMLAITLINMAPGLYGASMALCDPRAAQPGSQKQVVYGRSPF